MAENGNNKDFRQGILAAALLVIVVGGVLGMGASATPPAPPKLNEVVNGQIGCSLVTNSQTFLSTGFGLSITTAQTGFIKITGFDSMQQNSAANLPEAIALYRSTVGIPNNGVAPGGSDTQFLNNNALIPVGNGQTFVPFHLNDNLAQFIPVPVGTTYFYYFAVHSDQPATTISNSQCAMSALEYQ